MLVRFLRGVLRDPPDEKFVVLGLITTKKPELESLELLRRRVNEATRYVPMDRLRFKPPVRVCFVDFDNSIYAADQRRKVHLLVSAAQAL